MKFVDDDDELQLQWQQVHFCHSGAAGVHKLCKVKWVNPSSHSFGYII